MEKLLTGTDWTAEFRDWLRYGNPAELLENREEGALALSYDDGAYFVFVSTLRDGWLTVSEAYQTDPDGVRHELFQARSLAEVEKILAVRHGWAVRRYAGFAWIPERVERADPAPGTRLDFRIASWNPDSKNQRHAFPDRAIEDVYVNEVKVATFEGIEGAKRSQAAAASWVLAASLGEIINTYSSADGVPLFPLESSVPQPGTD